MGNLTVALRTAQSGLLTTQNAVDAVAHNIVNSNTEGYSRKIVNFQNIVLGGHGAGVRLSEFTRAIDEGLVKNLRQELSANNELATHASYFNRIQNLFGSPGDNTSIAHTLNQLHKAAESLALTPQGSIEQNQFARFAESVAIQLRSMSGEIQNLRTRADEEIGEGVARINELTEQIASLNHTIIRHEVIARDVTSLMDDRDLALKKLSELVEITTFKRSNSEIVVYTSEGFPLVDNEAIPITHNPLATITSEVAFASRQLDGIYLGDRHDGDEVTNRIKSGRIAALIAQRDQFLPNLQNQLDEMTSELRDSLNQLHNRGASSPGLQSLGGNRRFVDAENQTIRLDPADGTSDVAIVLLNSDGLQEQATTLNTIMQSGEYGTGTQPSRGPWSITEVAATVEDWLQGNGASAATASVDPVTGKLNIEINDTARYLAFRDETDAASGSEASDVAIGFDSDGDGTVNETVQGFSNFFKLNDLYVDFADGDVHDSAQLPGNFRGTAATLKFYDSQEGVGVGNEKGTVSIAAMSSLEDIAEAINAAEIGVSASVIPDGAGSRLRLINNEGLQMVVAQGESDVLLDNIGLAPSNAESASTLRLREDIKRTPSLSSTSLVQFDTERGRYVINSGDNTVIQSMAQALSSRNAFDSVGGLSNSNRTFEEYASDILGNQANVAEANTEQLQDKTNLVEALELEAERVSGVNLDEEMSNLIVYQQSFSAAARVISVIQQMFDTLNDAVR